MNNIEEFQDSVFPIGDENNLFEQYFTGRSYLNMLTTQGVTIGNVSFEPSCRNNWHIHHGGGQILLVTMGEGWYCEWGAKPIKLMRGDVVNISPNIKHWHGAAKNSIFQHLAIEVPSTNGKTEWLEAVSDSEYFKLGD